MTKVILTLVFAIVVLRILVGCTTEPTVQYVTQYTTPEDSLLVPCILVPPPKAEEYVTAPWNTKESVLTSIIRQQYYQTALCNTRFKALREWKLKTEALGVEQNKEK